MAGILGGFGWFADEPFGVTKPLALPRSAVSDLPAVLRAREGFDLIRESVRAVLQELIEAEAAKFIGATRYERSESCTNERNGSRPRMLATKASDIDLRIPKLRNGSFFRLILEPRRRIDQALYAVVMDTFVAGVSTRSVDDLAAALWIDSGISKSEVSLICAGLANMHDEWQSGERRYLSEGSMARLNPTGDTDTTTAIDSGAIDIEDQP